jgi:hypothetical protein
MVKTTVRVQPVSRDDRTRLAELAIAAAVSRMLHLGLSDKRGKIRDAERGVEPYFSE